MSQSEAIAPAKSSFGISGILRRILAIDELGVIAAMLGICLALTLLTDTFLTEQNLVSVLRQSSYIGIMAVGMVFVMSMGDIDLSVGAMLMFTSVTMSVMFREGYHPAIIIPAGILLRQCMWSCQRNALGRASDSDHHRHPRDPQCLSRARARGLGWITRVRL